MEGVFLTETTPTPTPTPLHPTTNQILFFQCSLTGTVSFHTVQPNMVSMYWMCNSKQVTLDCIFIFCIFLLSWDRGQTDPHADRHHRGEPVPRESAPGVVTGEDNASESGWQVSKVLVHLCRETGLYSPGALLREAYQRHEKNRLHSHRDTHSLACHVSTCTCQE